jgi:PPOX class probable F420-dependent enzyme
VPDLSVDLVIAAPAERVWNAIGPGFDRIGDWATAIPADRYGPGAVPGRAAAPREAGSGDEVAEPSGEPVILEGWTSPVGRAVRPWRPGRDRCFDEVVGGHRTVILGPGGRRHSVALIPQSHGDLVECPRVAALTTVMPDGSPHTSVVWCDFDGECVRVNTMRGFQKERNMRRDPRVTLLCYDPRQQLRYLEIRGRVVEMTQDGAAAHLDALASKYVGRPVRYFGDAVAADLAAVETPVLCRIRPLRVVASAW